MADNSPSWCSKNLLTLLVRLLILKITVGVVLNYRDYFPPNFDSDFLQDHDRYFWGGYHGAFYAHIASGPVSLVLGMMLISDKFRRAYPKWHRYLGRIQGLCVLFLVAPSGLWMSYHAMSGPIAGMGFACLAIVTGVCAALGWRAALKRRFAEHRRWMMRCFLVLCSAVVLRLISGLATVTDVPGDWPYPLAAWISWLRPLMIFEWSESRTRKSHQVAAVSPLIPKH